MTAQELSQVIFRRLRNVESFRNAVAHVDGDVVERACLAEAEFHAGDLEELGSSDVACMARSVIRSVGGVL